MNTHRFNLILPENLWKQISSLAETNHRSITQEIIAAIERHLVNNDFDKNVNEMAREAIREFILLGKKTTMRDLLNEEKVRELLNKGLDQKPPEEE